MALFVVGPRVQADRLQSAVHLMYGCIQSVGIVIRAVIAALDKG